MNYENKIDARFNDSPGGPNKSKPFGGPRKP